MKINNINYYDKIKNPIVRDRANMVYEDFQEILLKNIYLKSFLSEKNSIFKPEKDELLISGANSIYDEMYLDMFAKELATQDIFGLKYLFKEKQNIDREAK